MRALVVTLALLTGCAYYEDRVSDVGALLAPVDERVIHGDTQFTARERDATERACVAWQQFTRGRVRLSVVWDIDEFNYVNPPRPVLYRVDRTALTGHYGGNVEHDAIWWVPQTCGVRSLQACMQHEIGHMLTLSHTDIPGQVMSAVNPTVRFGRWDDGECQRVGVCRDRTLDVTTVTLTIDPSIPNVTPEYPR